MNLTICCFPGDAHILRYIPTELRVPQPKPNHVPRRTRIVSVRVSSVKKRPVVEEEDIACLKIETNLVLVSDGRDSVECVALGSREVGDGGIGGCGWMAAETVRIET